ncbi:MAG: recombinase family protein [Streptococcaceae bacterium]|nr:recombinase family protein [Streptococcaceae bacterium]
MAVIGFIHQSDERPNLADYPCEQYFQGNDFALFIGKLNIKDTIVISELLTIQKSTRQLGEIIPQLITKDIRLIALKEGVDTEKNKNFYQNVLSLAEMEKKLLQKRIQIGINQAKKRKTVLGRPRIDDKTIEKINELYHKRNHTIQMTADKLKISVGAVYKYLIKDDKGRNLK